MAGATFDASEVRALAIDLSNVGRSIDPKVRAVISRGALNIKRQMVAEMSASPSFKGTASSISYDLTGNAFYTEAEIGPKVGEGERGGLGSIAYFGSSTGGGTVPDPQGALNAEAPKVEAALLDVLGGIL